VIDEKMYFKPSVVFDVTSMSLRLIPRGKIRTYREGEDLYKLFSSLYKDIHPDMKYNEFIDLLKIIFPVYKNPRKLTNEFKITTFGLDKTLKSIGIRHFPIKTLTQEEILQIEM